MQDIDDYLQPTKRCRIISSDFADLLPDDIIVDSSSSIVVSNTRLDHHVDNGWTNLDSIAKYYRTLPTSNVEYPPVVTTYLDSDAVISTAVLILYMQRKIDIHDLLFTDLGKVLYSASYWCDYQIACSQLSPSINSQGEQLELWLRLEMQKHLGEDRAKPSKPKQTLVFRQLVAAMMSISQTKFPPACTSLDAHREMMKMKKTLRSYVRDDLSAKSFGVIWTFDDAPGFRIIPRAYFSLFTQPLIVRIIESRANPSDMKRQVFITPNPLLPDWKTLNLNILGANLQTTDQTWKLTGRRFMIGQTGTSWPVSALISALKKVDMRRLRDDKCPNWSIYEQ
jgi:hypothetical protein